MAYADVVVIGAGVAGLRCAADVAATYAPPGWHLIQATTLLDRPDADALQDRVQAHLGDLHRCPPGRWCPATVPPPRCSPTWRPTDRRPEPMPTRCGGR